MLPADVPRNLVHALLVDRDADVRHLYAEFLQQLPFKIEEADDGREALAMALTRHPDVVVTETRLPGIDGFDLCRLLKADALTQDIPLVVVTGNALDRDVERAKTAGADLVLAKPCSPELLAAELRRVVEQSRNVRARCRAAREKATGQIARSAELLDRSRATYRRVILSHAHDRRETSAPPLAPPQLICPSCGQPLAYVKSHIGGVSVRHEEQWDYFECTTGCGTFQYRQRTRRLRRVL